MHINDIHASEWGASLSEKLITPASEEPVMQGKILLYTNHIPKRARLKILIEGYNRQMVEQNISSLALQLSKEFTFQDDNSQTIFKCHPATPIVEETGFNTMLYISLEVDCIEYEEEAIISSTNTSFIINAEGNIDSPCIVELMPSKDIPKIMLLGLSDEPIFITDLKTNKLLVINSELGTVEEDGSNAYQKFDAWEFPRVKSGSNLIQLDYPGIKITIRYKARWN